jgi:predicted glycoside hydrolase/deacetylase ChbG (UPF0249 family)
MCHPGDPDAELAGIDSLTTPRRREFDFLASAAFLNVLATHRMTLS